MNRKTWRPNDTGMRNWIRSSFVPIIVSRLFDTKPLSEPVGHCWLGLWEQFFFKFESNYNYFHLWKRNFGISPANWEQFCLALNVLIVSTKGRFIEIAVTVFLSPLRSIYWCQGDTNNYPNPHWSKWLPCHSVIARQYTKPCLVYPRDWLHDRELLYRR